MFLLWILHIYLVYGVLSMQIIPINLQWTQSKMSSRLQTFKISSLKKTTAVLQVSSNISSKPAVALQLCHSVQNTNRRNVEQAFTLRALKISDSRKKKKKQLVLMEGWDWHSLVPPRIVLFLWIYSAVQILLVCLHYWLLSLMRAAYLQINFNAL